MEKPTEQILTSSPQDERSRQALTEKRQYYDELIQRAARIKSFEQLKNEISGRTRDDMMRALQQEILNLIDENKLKNRLRHAGGRNNFESFLTSRGTVFEYLALHEVNDAEQNSVLANFLLECLSRPNIIDLKDTTLKRPDRIGVVLNRETNQAEITGIFEVKIRHISHKAREQIQQFYADLDKVIKHLNERLVELIKKYNLVILPANGIVLREYEDLDKYVITTRDASQARVSENFLREEGWINRRSVFTEKNVELITAYLLARMSPPASEPAAE